MSWYKDEFSKWKEYSKHCPWREGEVCKGPAIQCTPNNCAIWYFLKNYDKSVLESKEE